MTLIICATHFGGTLGPFSQEKFLLHNWTIPLIRALQPRVQKAGVLILWNRSWLIHWPEVSRPTFSFWRKGAHAQRMFRNFPRLSRPFHGRDAPGSQITEHPGLGLFPSPVLIALPLCLFSLEQRPQRSCGRLLSPGAHCPSAAFRVWRASCWFPDAVPWLCVHPETSQFKT